LFANLKNFLRNWRRLIELLALIKFIEPGDKRWHVRFFFGQCNRKTESTAKKRNDK
jgi:hypothetical protein